jgi:hypothetical protein
MHISPHKTAHYRLIYLIIKCAKTHVQQAGCYKFSGGKPPNPQQREREEEWEGEGKGNGEKGFEFVFIDNLHALYVIGLRPTLFVQ